MAYTINANAKNVWIRDNEDTRDLSIQTDASSVYLDNGRTLEQELGEGSMVSNVATVDSAMSKIIDGTLDGAYESGVMYGRSLVNLSNLHKSFNDVTLSDYYVDTSLCETSKLKLGTPYTLVFYTTVHGGDHDIYDAFELGVGNELHGTNTHPETTTNYWGELVKNGWSKVCVTFTDFLGYKYLSLRPIRCNAPESGKSIRFSIEGFILLEGDWSNKDLPFNDYFTGLCDVKMPILRNVGKNLWSPKLSREWNGESFVNGGSITVRSTTTSEGQVTYAQYGCLTRLDIGQEYTISFDKTSSARQVGLWGYNPNTNDRTTQQGAFSNNSFTFIATTNYIALLFYSALGQTCTFSNIQIEESPTPTAYEDHKTNILHTSEEIVLREVGGVQDTYNLLTGEYVQRIKERVFNGSETWAQNGQHTDGSYRHICNTYTDAKTSSNNVLCDKMSFVKVNSSTGEGMTSDIHITFTTSTGKVQIATTKPLSELKTWLSQNPITVQYELAEPITTIVEPLTIPFAYQNGHIILESGSEEQSLLPTLEYSTVVNRTGQVEGVAKVIQKQEKQLTMLEQMLIQNIIGLDYSNTVLALNLKINEVM